MTTLTERIRNGSGEDITYPPEMLPHEPGAIVIIACNRPDCIGELCRHCEIVAAKEQKP